MNLQWEVQQAGFRFPGSAHRKPVRMCLEDVVVWGPAMLYIGRGSAVRGLPPSLWQNPHKVSACSSRAAAIDKFRQRLLGSPELLEALPHLASRILVCHCRPAQACHAGALIEAFVAIVEQRAASVPPTDDAVSIAVAARRAAGAGGLIPSPVGPPRELGQGGPLWIGSGHRRRLFIDGGGLCSPGLWPPERRHPGHPIGAWLRGRLLGLLQEWETTHSGVIRSVLVRLAVGFAQESPFPATSIERVREELRVRFPQSSSLL